MAKYTTLHETKIELLENRSVRQFHDNILYSFLSNDQISCIYLRDSSNKQYVYQSEMNKVTGLAISCDHTFKVIKNIGVLRPS